MEYKKIENGVYKGKDLCEMCGWTHTTFQNKSTDYLEKLRKFCDVEKEGTGKGVKYIISNTPDSLTSEALHIKNDYYTTKDLFKPLIYGLVLSRPEHTYIGSFNNWMEYSKITTQAWRYMNNKYNEGKIKDKYLNEFFRVEGKSLNYMFKSVLASMKKEGSIDYNTVRVAVIDNRDIIEEFGSCDENIPPDSYSILEGEDKEEIDAIEQAVCEKFGVGSLVDLAYGNKFKGISKDLIKLKEAKNEFNSIILKEYGYHMCFKATKVSIKDTLQIDKFKEKYGITDDMQKVVTICKGEIYKSRIKKAKARYESRVQRINDKYDEDKKSELCADEFAELERELELGECGSFENYINNWTDFYKKYIHKGI